MSSLHPATNSMHPAHATLSPPRPLSILPAMRHSAIPTRITIIPHVPALPARPTLPPGVRAARMMGTVRKAASRLARRLPRHIDVEDLVGAGSLGLADAFSRRGAMPGSEFEAFAAYRIRGAMLDELRRLDSMPRRARRSAKRVALAQRTVEQKLGRPANDDEIAAELTLDIQSYQALRTKIDASRAPVMLSALGSAEDETPHDVPDTKAEGPDALASRAQIGERLAEKIHTLPERMRFALLALYVEGKTLKEIGVSLGVSESRICQIHTEALALLRATLLSVQEIEAAPASGVRARAKANTGASRSRAA